MLSHNTPRISHRIKLVAYGICLLLSTTAHGAQHGPPTPPADPLFTPPSPRSPEAEQEFKRRDFQEEACNLSTLLAHKQEHLVNITSGMKVRRGYTPRQYRELLRKSLWLTSNTRQLVESARSVCELLKTQGSCKYAPDPCNTLVISLEGSVRRIDNAIENASHMHRLFEDQIISTAYLIGLRWLVDEMAKTCTANRKYMSLVCARDLAGAAVAERHAAAEAKAAEKPQPQEPPEVVIRRPYLPRRKSI